MEAAARDRVALLLSARRLVVGRVVDDDPVRDEPIVSSLRIAKVLAVAELGEAKRGLDDSSLAVRGAFAVAALKRKGGEGGACGGGLFGACWFRKF